MIEKIMSKLGMVVLWCIVIIYGIGVITHICSDIIGVVVLVILAVISIIFVLYAKRYKILNSATVSKNRLLDSKLLL